MGARPSFFDHWLFFDRFLDRNFFFNNWFFLMLFDCFSGFFRSNLSRSTRTWSSTATTFFNRLFCWYFFNWLFFYNWFWLRLRF